MAAKKSPAPRSARPAKSVPAKATTKKAAVKKAPAAKATAKRATSKQAATRPTPTPPPSTSGLGPVIDQMGPRLRAEFELLHKSEAKIVRALQQPATAQAFAADPLATLATIGVSVPPIIKQQLKAAAVSGEQPNLAAAQGFRLPNGQVITANVNVRFIGTGKR